MATFKVGQRVRMNPTQAHHWSDEGTIVAFDPMGSYTNPNSVWVVRADNHPASSTHPLGPGCFWCASHTLAPLTDPDPREESWADAKVREVTKPQHMEPEREHHGTPVWEK